jgi:hypothetical protein
MNVKITQYTDRIYLDNCSGQKLIEINYSGSFVGDVIPEGVTVMMNKNKICIMDIGDGFDNQVFMYYYGKLSIKSAFYYENDIKTPIGITRNSDEVNRISSKLSESTTKYEDFDKTNKYIKNVKTLLSYRKAGRVINVTNRKTYNSPSKDIKNREMKILKKLKQGVK